MMHSVADVQGLNAITEDILGNAAQAMIGMVQARRTAKPRQLQRPAIALSMFGVTTPCIRQIADALDKEWDCLIFHATGIRIFLPADLAAPAPLEPSLGIIFFYPWHG